MFAAAFGKLFREISNDHEIDIIERNYYLCFEGQSKRNEDWNDNYFHDKYIRYYQMREFPDLDTAADYALAFLKFYVTGEVTSTFSYTLCGVFCGMVLDGGVRLCSSMMIDKGKFESIWNTVTESTFRSQWKPWNNYHFIKDVQGNKHRGISANQINTTQANDWVNNMRKVLEDKSDPQRQTAINIVGFLALNMMQLSTKPIDKVNRTIILFTRKHLEKFFNAPKALANVPPPCAHAPSYFKARCDMGGATSNWMMTLLITSYINPDGEAIQSVTEILKAGCMEALAFFGFELIFWLKQARDATGIPISNILQSLLFQACEPAVITLLKFFIDYVADGNNQKSLPWSRIIDFGVLFSATFTTSNLILVCHFIALCAKADVDHKIWKIQQVYGCDEDVKKYACYIAKAIVDVHNDNLNVDANEPLVWTVLSTAHKNNPDCLLIPDRKDFALVNPSAFLPAEIAGLLDEYQKHTYSAMELTKFFVSN